MEIPEQRLPFAVAFPEAIQLGEQFVRDVTRAATRGHGVGGAAKDRPVLANEALPSLLIARSAGRGKGEVRLMRGGGILTHAGILSQMTLTVDTQSNGRLNWRASSR